MKNAKNNNKINGSSQLSQFPASSDAATVDYDEHAPIHLPFMVGA
jgi:hypothetical protein